MRPIQHPEGGRPLPDRPVDFECMVRSERLDFHCELYDVVAELDLAVCTIGPGAIRLRNGRSLGLLQLAEQCHLRPRDDWRELIGAHLRTMTSDLREMIEPLSVFDLRVRLVPDTLGDSETLRSLGARPFAEGILQVLAIEVDHAVRCVSTRDVAEHGWDLEEVWASALAQTEVLEVADEVHAIDIGGVDIIHVFGERSFTASMIGVVDRLVGEVAHVGGSGAIVALPLRHSLLVHPVDNDGVIAAIVGMIPITRQLFEQGPNSVSPHLYWWNGGRLEWIPTFFDGTIDGVDFYPSNDLWAVIADVCS